MYKQVAYLVGKQPKQALIYKCICMYISLGEE